MFENHVGWPKKKKCWITKRTVFVNAAFKDRSQRFESSFSSRLSGPGGFSVYHIPHFLQHQSHPHSHSHATLIELANGRRDLSSQIASRSSCSSARKLLALTIFPFVLCLVAEKMPQNQYQ